MGQDKAQDKAQRILATKRLRGVLAAYRIGGERWRNGGEQDQEQGPEQGPEQAPGQGQEQLICVGSSFKLQFR